MVLVINPYVIIFHSSRNPSTKTIRNDRTKLTCSSSRAIRTPEHNGHGAVPRGHVKLLRRGVDDLVDRLEGKVERHKLHNRTQVLVRRASREPRETHLRDRRINNSLLSVLLVKPLRYLFADKEKIRRGIIVCRGRERVRWTRSRFVLALCVM